MSNTNRTSMTIKTLRAMADSNGFIFKAGRKTPTLRICDNGTILRADVEFSLCVKMTLKQAAQALA